MLKKINAQLEKSLIKIQKDKKDLEIQVEEMSSKSEHSGGLDLIIAERDKEINHLASIITDKDDQLKILELKLNRKEKEVSHVKDGLEISIDDKNKMINKLRNQLTQKTTDLLVLSEKISHLEENDKSANISTRLVERIYDLLMHKGFLSDKEFDQIQNEIRREQMVYY